MIVEAIASGVTADYRGASPSSASSATPFSQVFQRYIDETNQSLLQANQGLQNLANGQATSVHQVMIDLEEARLRFQTLVQIRNRALEAYQDIMRMSI